MRAGLVFLAGLLVGGLAVAWLVSEVPAESESDAGLAGAPAVPAPSVDTRSAVLPGTGPVPAERDVSGNTLEVSVDQAVEDTLQENPAPTLAPALVHTETPTGGGTAWLPRLRIPVEGVEAGELFDSFADARGEDRVHDALDIMAPEGTPVLAVADGPVVKLFDSVPGGTTLYQFDDAGRVAFYYAHMQRYADGIEEGKRLRQGEVIGYVGHTGNANPAAPHLHFAIFVLGPEKNWWEGEAINPYPLLVGAGN